MPYSNVGRHNHQFLNSNKTINHDCWLHRRDEALAAIQEAMRAQQQQELSVEMEMQGFKKDIVKEQVSFGGT